MILISEKLCDKSNLDGDRHPTSLTMVVGQRTRSIEVAQKFLESFNPLPLTIDFFVMESTPFDVIVGVSALEALQECLRFGLQQIILVSSSKKKTLPFKGAVVEAPVSDCLGKDSQDFTSG